MYFKNNDINHNITQKVFKRYKLHKCVRISKLENQRTNGPVNAHLKPEIYTNKLV